MSFTAVLTSARSMHGYLTLDLAVTRAEQLQALRSRRDSDVRRKVLRRLKDALPLILDILRDIETVQRSSCEIVASDAIRREVAQSSIGAATTVLLRCKEGAETLHRLVEEAVLLPRASRLARYAKVAQSVRPGKRQNVEDLVKDILTKLQLPHASHFFKA